MTVRHEEVLEPVQSGKAVVNCLRRGAAGAWTAEIELDLVLEVGDGRQVLIRKVVNVRATQQRGRRPGGQFS